MSIITRDGRSTSSQHYNTVPFSGVLKLKLIQEKNKQVKLDEEDNADIPLQRFAHHVVNEGCHGLHCALCCLNELQVVKSDISNNSNKQNLTLYKIYTEESCGF